MGGRHYTGKLRGFDYQELLNRIRLERKKQMEGKDENRNREQED